MSFIQNFDNQTILNIYDFMINHQILKNILSFITTLGNSGFIWILFAIIFYTKKSTRKYGLFMLIALIIGFIIGNIILKNLIGRERPFIQLDLIPFINAPKGYSFPSGHSLSSFIGASCIFFINKKWGVLAFILAFLIAISRVLLVVHYPTDIIFGALLGILISFLLFKTLSNIFKFKDR